MTNYTSDMDLRDYFAGQVLTTLESPYFHKGGGHMSERYAENFASDAYAIADAMIKERVKS